MPEATLLVIQGPDQSRRYEIGTAPVHLGRGAQNEIRIQGFEASRKHAVIYFDNGGWRISDLGSAQGTYVNGQPVTSAPVQPGDQIQIGRTILLFTGQRQPRAQAPGERISLVARSDRDDQSRIVGQAMPLATDVLSSLAQAGANLQLLYQIAEEAVRPTTSLDELLGRILDLTLRAVGADRGCMLVANSKTDRIEPRVVRHRPSANVNERMPISTSIVEYVIQKAQGVRTSDAQHDSRFDTGQSIVKSGIREAMCVPMQGRYELMGVIYVDTTSTLHPAHLSAAPVGQFNDQLLRLLLAIGRQSALAIENFRYQDALVTSERLAAVGQTIAVLSHHIKNILQGIRGGGYLIDKGLNEHNDELVRAGWGTVERNQERIYNLVMDMLTFGKEREPKLAPADLDAIVSEIVELSKPRIGKSGIALSTAAASPTPRSLFDAEGIHRALLNVVTNAVDALEETPSPRIQIRYGFDSEHEQLWVEVEDNGPGIDDAALAKLYTPFESSKGAKGTGLGLAVTRKILDEHGGKISVRTRLGVGTCFRLEWPYLVEEPEQVEQSLSAD